MKFAILGHLIDQSHLAALPDSWIQDNKIVSPEFCFNDAKGHIIGIMLTSKQMINTPIKDVRQKILDSALYAQNHLDIELIQLGALTTSLTSGGAWLKEQKKYHGLLNHGDSYTAAVTCQTVLKSLELLNFKPIEKKLAIIGAYGIIGEAVSKILVSKFYHTFLIGRQKEKLMELSEKINGNFETSNALITKDADIIVTATSHPTALLNSDHLKKNAIIIDVSIPPNLSIQVCRERSDIKRIDGGYIDVPEKYEISLPGVPNRKILSCMAEAIMQSMENEHKNHIGSIDINHLKKTIEWGEKYGFKLGHFTNFGEPIHIGAYKR